jgi:predicted RNA binding protein YcfA (HicA-like mRNA interferase family)
VKPITGLELRRKLEQAGWALKRVRGSHHIFVKPGVSKIISVPIHGTQQLKPGMATRIAKDAGLDW